MKIQWSEDDGYWVVYIKYRNNWDYDENGAYGGYTSYISAIEEGYKHLLKMQEKYKVFEEEENETKEHQSRKNR